jgi:hypothetical protein|tara:strand:- start:110 stop:439 length:330 start_codon:yes stop_codon:yes gene_type:complete
MTIKFPRTYKDLQNADYVWDIEKGGSDGVFIYLKESYLQDANGVVSTCETIAWGKNLQEALDNLRYDYWKYIDPTYKEKKYKPRKTKAKKQTEYKGSFTKLQKLLSKIL